MDGALPYSIFLLSARHIAEIDPQHSDETMDTHRRYLDLVLRRHSDDIMNLSEKTVDAVCITSSILRVTAFVIARPLLEFVYTTNTTSVMVADDEGCSGCLQGIMEVDRK